MELIAVKDEQQVSAIACKRIIKQIQSKSSTVLGLATGRTVIRTYEMLIQAYKAGKVSFSDVTTFNLDEYIGLGPKHPNSFHAFMDTHFFQHVNIRRNMCYIPNGISADVESECNRYEELIQQAGGIDLQILGIGRNGHIGFNEPGTPFTKRTHIAELAQSTRLANQHDFATLDEVPTHAITMGIATILDSREILLLVTGSLKAQVLHQVLYGNITESVPATALRLHKNVTIIADQEALSNDKIICNISV